MCFSLLATEHKFRVKSGDSLTKYFHKLGLSDSLLINLLNSSKSANKLNNLKVGKTLIITTKNSKFKRLSYELNKTKNLVIKLQGYKFLTQIIDKKTNKTITNLVKKELKIKTSLARAVTKSGLKYKHLQQILKIIRGKIDPKKLQKNDKFKIYLQDDEIIVLIFNNKKHFYFWDGLYYNQNGLISTNMFLTAPLKYKRISSGFTYSRFHPILKKYLPHRAIDYAAPKGTPIYAVADGTVSFKGYKGALGNSVAIKHNYGYKTVYAHLSAFKRGLYKGKKVKQGEVIGYVGSTGRSTGNHLHYELKKNGEYKNPLKHKPKLVYRLKGKEKQEFLQYIKQFK
jgi:murein DD-endopeptidase MepM/ murein hydrolase activator NlpD